MRGMRRKNDDAPVISRDAFREKIGHDVERFLADGGEVSQIELGKSKTPSGLTKNFVIDGPTSRGEK